MIESLTSSSEMDRCHLELDPGPGEGEGRQQWGGQKDCMGFLGQLPRDDILSRLRQVLLAFV